MTKGESHKARTQRPNTNLMLPPSDGPDPIRPRVIYYMWVFSVLYYVLESRNQ